jgi:ABC-type phosphate transport system substrate-binding protein
MKSLSVRGLVSACIIPAAAVAVLAAPGTAGAYLGVQCSGANVTGQGSSLQAIGEQNIIDPEFNLSGAKKACSGKFGDKLKPEVKYTSTGSGTGLISWGAEETPAENAANRTAYEGTHTKKEAEEKYPLPNYSISNGYLGTDEPPNTKQAENIESWRTTPLGFPTVETIPIFQGAVSIPVNLPTGCTEATSKGAAGRLVLNNSTLAGIFGGTITKWNEIKDDGDKLTCGSKADEESKITVIVRFDQSGTTHIFKRYLFLQEPAALAFEGPETITWGEASEGSKNTSWPVAANVVRPAAKGGGEEVAKIAATPGSIGYANLADARKNGGFSKTGVGGPKTPKFWVELQHGEKTVSGKTTYTYADPSTNKDVEPQAKANCAKTLYINGTDESKGEFPPASVWSNWNEVSTSRTSATYSLCGLTYAVAFGSEPLTVSPEFGGYGAYPGTIEGEATTMQNFESFQLEAAGGQKLIGENRDYLALPSTGALITEARKGAAAIQY